MTLNVFKIFGILCLEKDIQNNYFPNEIHASVENTVSVPELHNSIYKHLPKWEPFSQTSYFWNIWSKTVVASSLSHPALTALPVLPYKCFLNSRREERGKMEPESLSAGLPLLIASLPARATTALLFFSQYYLEPGSPLTNTLGIGF